MVQRKIKPTAIRHWEPVRKLETKERQFLEDLDRFLEGNFPSLRFIWSRIPGEERPWVPAAEMYETEDKFVIRVELPGVNPDDVDISIAGDYLIVKGQRELPENVAAEQYHECERCYGKFYRRIGLPAEADLNKTEAAYENGVLEVHVAKSKTAKTTKIRIKKA